MKSKKQKALDVLKNPYGKVICIDLDQTLVDGTYWVGDKKHPPVNKKMQELVFKLDDAGATIIIWTARPLKAVKETYKWLGQNNLQYPLAVRIKPPASLYIDDKALNVDDVI